MLSNLRGPRVKCLHTLRSGKSVAASRPIVAKMASQSPPSEANTVALVQTAIAWANLHGLVRLDAMWACWTSHGLNARPETERPSVQRCQPSTCSLWLMLL